MDKTYEKVLYNAKNLICDNNFKEAEAFVDTLIQLDETNFEGFYAKAICEANLSKFDWALKSIEKAISLNTTFADLYTNKAKILLLKNECKSAINEYEKALKLDKDNLAIKYMLADALVKEKRYNEADEIFEEEINKDNKAISPYFNKATTYQVNKEYEKAVECYDEWIENTKPFAGFHFYKSECLHRLGKVKESILELWIANSIAPGNYEVLLKLLELSALAWSNEDIVKVRDKILDINPKDETALKYSNY